MSRHPSKTRAYKEITVQQLRSFSETARLGSFTAAAASLGLASPTVLQQVRALERDLGERLLDPHGRGCRLTEAGQLMADLAGPLVSGVATLKRRFHEALANQAPQLVMAATPRILAEDLPECVAEFRRRNPDVRLSLKDMLIKEIFAVVEAGEVDVGLVHGRDPDLPLLNPRLEFEPVYEVDIALITPPDHPLARRRQVRPRDLRGYPLVNSVHPMLDLTLEAVLGKAGVLEAQPPLVEATFTSTTCRYVEMGFGVGLIFVPRGRQVHPGFHVRVMSRDFGRTVIYQVHRKGVPPFQSVAAFLDIVKDRLRHATGER
jgi:DNA-binding transcriptional LysR family regulator